MKNILPRRTTLITLFSASLVIGLSAFETLKRSDNDPTVTKSAVPISDFTNFESAHVHPLDMTPDKTKLLAVNTGNNSLEVYSFSPGGLIHIASIPVGLDPVSVRARTNNEVWVVNQVSDEVSVVDLTQKAVIRSLGTENEPADVVFAGSPQRAFVSCAERESVQVFDPANLNTAPTEVLLKGEQPRALAVSPDGNTVYAAFFESGNQTTVVNGSDFMADGFCSPQGGCTSVPNDVTNPAGPYGGIVPVPNSGMAFDPPMNPSNPLPPGTNSMVVRKNAAGQWMDANGGNWTSIVTGAVPGVSRVAGWDMPDRDVAMINANSPSTGSVTYKAHLGNILMAMAVHPLSGEVFVVGTDATNEIRFEPNLNGKFLRVNVARFMPAGNPLIADMNPHINYTTSTSPPNLRQQSIGDPRGIAWKSDGTKAYVTGMGSNNVIMINTTGSRTSPDPITVGEGPTGIVLDEVNNRGFVLNKFDGSISTIDLTTNKETARTSFFDPTPLVIKVGRKHLYDTHAGSGHGHIACGSCHLDGKWDRLAWDLGNPAGDMTTVVDPAGTKVFHPMKGLKTTQFLIDIINRGSGKLHWRGDKSDFGEFAGAFSDLQGADSPMDAAGMQEFSDFLAATWHVPNPYRTYRPELSVAASTERMNPGKVRFTGTTFQTIPTAGVKLFVAVNVNCSHCHQTGTGRGHLPGNGSNSGAGSPAIVDMTNNVDMVPDLRSTYRKNGFFYNTTECTSGFGMMSDGVMETVFNQSGTASYLGDYEPELLSWSGGITQVNSPASHNFDLVHPSQDAMPAVGLRHTLNGGVGSTTQVTFMKTLVNDKPTEYAMIVKGIYAGEQRGFYYDGSDSYQSDFASQTVTHAQLVASAQGGSPLTWTIVHPNTKIRAGVDRDSDGTFDYVDGDVELDLAVMLDGPMNGTTMNAGLKSSGLLPTNDPYGMGEVMDPSLLARTGNSAPVDWVVVELRDPGNQTIVVDAIAALVLSDGRVVMSSGKSPLLFASAARGSYHVAVKHRNHLGVMTLLSGAYGTEVQRIDLSDPAVLTFGTNARVEKNGITRLWSGDVNEDGVVRYTGVNNDRDLILTKIGGVVPTASVTGYVPEDVNLNGTVLYTGALNDRDPILENIGGVVPTAVRVEQLP